MQLWGIVNPGEKPPSIRTKEGLVFSLSTALFMANRVAWRILIRSISIGQERPRAQARAWDRTSRANVVRLEG